MTAAEIATLSIKDAGRFAFALNVLVTEKIALSLVAQWLYEQDESCDPAKILATFNEAVRFVRHHYA